MGLARWYKRLRHTYGFGVHSPSAYSLVMETLRESGVYGYYAYGELGGRRRRELRLVYRLSAHFRPSEIAFYGDNPALEAAARMGLQKSASSGSLMAIVDKDYRGEGDSRLEEAAVVYFGDARSALAAKVKGGMTAGHIFAAPRRALIKRDPGLPLEVFSLNF